MELYIMGNENKVVPIDDLPTNLRVVPDDDLPETVKKKEPTLSESPATASSGSLTVAKPSSENGGKVNLDPQEEKSFKDWYSKVAKHKQLDPNPDSKEHFYDYRAFYKNEPVLAKKLLSQDPDAHFTDIGKLPGHPTFSNESMYYRPGMKAVRWEGEKAIPIGNDFLVEANSLQPSEEQKREEQFQQTGNTGQENLKAKEVRLADKQLAKEQIEREAAKNYKAIEDNEEYLLMSELKNLLSQPQTPEITQRIEEIKATPVSDDWRKEGKIQVSESQTIPVPNVKKSKFKTYGEMLAATEDARNKYNTQKEEAELLNAELTPAIQQKRNDAAYIPDGVDEQGNEYLKLNPMQTFIEGFGGSVDAIGLGLKKLNPLYSREELKNDLKIKYLRENVLFPKQADEAFNIKTPLGDIPTGEATGMLGGVTPLIGSGGLGGLSGGLGALTVNALTFGTMDLGGGLYEGFAEAKGKGLSDDEAMAYADKIGLEKGTTGAFLGATIPMQGKYGRKIFLNQAEAGALKRFLAEQGVMVPAFMGKSTADNIAAREFGSARQVNEGVGDAGVSALMIGAMTHAIGAGIKIPAKTKDIFENAIAKNYTSLGAVINKAAMDGVIDFGTSQRIAEKAKAFEVVPKDLEPKLEEKILPKQIEIDNLTKESEGKKGAFVEANEYRIEELNKEIHEDLGTPLNSKEQKRYDDLIAKRDEKPAEDKPKEKMTTSEKTELKHFEKRIKVAEKKAEKIENDRAEGLETVDAEPPANEAKEEIVVDTTVEKPAEAPVEETPVTDEALQFIDDHAVQGDIQKGDYRPDFGMTSKELTRGLEQIRQGKDGAPAKQIRAKIAEWKEKGFVDMIAGGGGTKAANDRRAIPFDIAKEVSELTEAEATEVLPKIDEIQSNEANLEEWVTSKGYEKPDGTLDLEKLSVDLKSAEENPWSDFLELTDEQFNNLKQAVENEKSNTAPKETSDASGSKDNEGQAQKRTKLEEKIDGINGAKETQRNNPIGKEVTFEQAGSEKTGIVKSIDPKTGDYKVLGTGANKGVNYTVKAGDARGTEAIDKAKQSFADGIKKIDALIKTPPKDSQKPPVMNAVVPKDVLTAPMKLLGVGDKLLASITSKIEDAIGKSFRRATDNSNKYVSRSSSELQGLFKQLALTGDEMVSRRKALGQMNAAPLKAVKFYQNGVNIVGKTPESLANVHQVLDPEVYSKRGTTPKTEADLSPAEKQLYDILRATNDMIHDWHYVNGRITEETYNKNKGTYAPRFYDNIEFEGLPNDLKGAFEDYAKQSNFSYVKERKAFEDVMAENEVTEDPVYGTSMRLAQMLRNQAVLEYASDLSSRIKTYKEGDANIPSGYVKLEGGGEFGNINTYGKLTNKYVPRDIAEDFKGSVFINEAANEVFKLFSRYDRLPIRQFLKKTKTLYNPITQLGNIGSNYVFAMMNGIDPLSYQTRKFEAANHVKDKSDLYVKLVEEGILGTDITTKDLKTEAKGEPASEQGMLSLIDDKVSEFYGSRDDIAKVAAYLAHTKDYGRSEAEALKRVSEGFQNYNNVGRFYDLAAKTPVVGNPFIKFKGDLMRIMKNNFSQRPLTNIALLAGLNLVANAFSKWADEDETIKQIRERRKFIPKIPLPDAVGGDIPLVWKTPIGEINAARYFSPLNIYDMGDKGSTIEEVSQFLPYQLKKNEGTDIPLPAISDPFLGVYAQVAFDKDFRGKPILDPESTKWKSGNATTQEKIQNAMTFVARQQVPFFSNADDMLRAYNGEPDYYGRNRDLKQSLLNNMVKIQDFEKPEAVESLSKEIDYRLGQLDKLNGDVNAANNLAEKNIAKINERDISDENKQKLIRDEYTRAENKVAEIMDKQAEIKQSLIEPEELLKKIGGSVSKSKNNRPKFKGFKAFSGFKKTGN